MLNPIKEPEEKPAVDSSGGGETDTVGGGGPRVAVHALATSPSLLTAKALSWKARIKKDLPAL